MKRDYRIRAQKFFRDFYPYLLAQDSFYCTDCVERAIERYIADHPSRKVDFACGSARFAIITSDYVIKWDYDNDNVFEIGGCEDEVKFYRFARENGFAHLFAEITPSEYHGFDFYIMPRAYRIGYRCHRGMDISYYISWDEARWLVEHVRDLHSFNWGFVHNAPVVIDYAMTEEVINRSSGSSSYT